MEVEKTEAKPEIKEVEETQNKEPEATELHYTAEEYVKHVC